MPPRPKKVCSWYGCTDYAVGSGSRCDKHQAEKWAGTRRKGGREERGYGWAWMRLRLHILKRDNYLCHCPECLGGRIRLTPATEVDHIVGKAQGGTDDPSNLRAINTNCHKRITAGQAAMGRR